MSGNWALTALVIAAVAAPPAMAQEDGVFVDPDSPAGKEYAVPLDEARRQAAGGDGGSAGQADGSQPLFGAGIEPRAEADGAGGGSDGGRSGEGAGGETGAGGASGDGGGDGGASAGSREAGSGAQDAPAIEAAASGGSGGLLTAGIAAAVLLAGLLAGLGLRRLQAGD